MGLSPYGQIVIGGFSFQIGYMCILKGKLHITATGDGPIPAMRDQPVTIFGADGQGFVQGGSVSVRPVPEGFAASFTVDIELERCQ